MTRRAMEALDLLRAMQNWTASRDPEIAEVLVIPPEMIGDGLSPHERDNLLDMEASLYVESTPYWVSAEMALVVEAASAQLPHGATIQPPTRAGLVLFEKPLRLQGFSAEDDPIIGYRWGVIGEGQFLAGDLRLWRELSHEGRMMSADEARARAGCPVWPGYVFRNHTVTDNGRRNEQNALLTFWLLCSQRVATVQQRHPDRPTRRRLQRNGMTDVPDVSIVQLRRPNGSRDNPEGSPVDWSHRWIVGGHWADYWCGPKDDQHLEPRWIAPYVKGPDDKPLATDRVYELIR